MRRIIFLAMVVFAVVSDLLSGPVLAEAPSTKLLTTSLVSPASAFAFYGAGTTHTVGLASASTRPPEIKALARALGRNGTLTGDALAKRVASYVRSNIAVEFRFGLGKGARGAVIDQSGTPFDQADAMVQILREAGATASFQLGTITLTPAQFGKWTGLVKGLNESAQTFTVSAQAACQFLADGAIPATVNGSSSCVGLSGDLTTVTLAHVWVATGGKAYDPSFKQNVLKAGIDIAAGMGCNNDAAPTCGAQLQTAALTGATQGTAFGASYVASVNTAQIDSTLQTLAAGLQPDIAAAGADAQLPSIIGGMLPDDSYQPVASATLSYQTSLQFAWSGDVPDAYRTKFRIQFYGIDYSVFADEAVGRRMYTYIQYYTANYNKDSKLYIEGAVVASATNVVSSSRTDYYTLSINYPYAAISGAYGDVSNVVAAQPDPRDPSDMCIHYQGPVQPNCDGSGIRSAAYLIFQLGYADVGQTAYQGSLMGIEAAGLNFRSATPVYGVPYEWPNTVTRYLTQVSKTGDLVEGVSKSAINFHGIAGVAFALYGQPTMAFNVQSSYSVTSRTNNPTDSQAAFKTLATLAAALEGSVRQQSDDSVESDSSASYFRLANSKAFRLYEVNSSNISAVLPNTTNYSASRQSLLTSYVSDGLSMIIPDNGAIGSVSYNGIAFNFPSVGEFGFDGTRAAYLVAEEYKGGSSSKGLDPFESAVDAIAPSTASLKSKNSWAIDPSAGSVSLTPSPDLALGSGPFSLNLQRTYSSKTSAISACFWIFAGGGLPGIAIQCSENQPLGGDSQIGAGWDHSLNENGYWGTNALEALGVTSALRATSAIAVTAAMVDANRTSTLIRRLVTIFSGDIFGKRLLQNSFDVSLGGRSLSYLKLPDGTYDPPASERGGTLVMSGARGGPFVDVQNSPDVANFYYNNVSFLLTLADGTRKTFYPGNRRWTNSTISTVEPYTIPRFVNVLTQKPFGGNETINFGEDYDRKFLGVTNSAGYAINQGDAKSFSDSSGRSFHAACTIWDINWSPAAGRLDGMYDDCEDVFTFTDALGNVTRLKYTLGADPSQGTNRREPIKQIFVPSDANNPFAQFSYDADGNLASVTDGNSHTTTVYTGSVSNERSRLGETVAADGGVTSTLFNQHGKPLVVTDPLGRQTSNNYDAADRLLRSVNPEGDATEYQYDVRGNVTRECHISKTATPVGRACDPVQDLVTTTTYVEGPTVWTCANPKVCNKPATVVDPRQIMTKYTWSTVHGQMLTETKGLNTAGTCQIAGGVCPVTTYGYTSFTGTDGAIFYLLTSKQDKIDATTATTTTWVYNSSNHFALREQVVDSGGLALRSCFTADSLGNIISQTTPNAALASCP